MEAWQKVSANSSIKRKSDGGVTSLAKACHRHVTCGMATPARGLAEEGVARNHLPARPTIVRKY